jgi:hypothetical protein
MVNKWKSGLCLIIVIVLVLASAAVWATSTPTYAFYKFRSALKEHNSEKALSYMDIDRIIEKMVFDLTTKESPGGNMSKDELLGYDLANQMLEAMKPMLAETLKSAIVQSIKGSTGNNTVKNIEQGSILDYKIERDGAIAYVNLKKNPSFKLKMAKGPDTGWIIVDLLMPDATKGLNVRQPRN